MADRNAYFCLKIDSGSTFLVLIPSEGAGSNLDGREIMEYLENRRLVIDKKALMSAITALKEKTEIQVIAEHAAEVDESVEIQVSSDKNKVIGRFYPSSKNGRLLTKEEIIKSLISNGVKYGARNDSIEKFLSEREYCKDYELALALLPTEGRNAEIVYHFNTDLTRKPKTNEDGSVDFHQLDNIEHITKNTLLAELIPAVKGNPGINVLGVGIKPKQVVHKTLKFGNNIQINEERTKIYSMVDGHVSLLDGAVFVSNVYEVIQDVDASTGNIDFEGSVNIKGNVRAGYRVAARGDIIVNGVVEGAELTAGGQIIVKLGVQGMNRAVLKAGSNVIAKFIESAEIISGGYLTTECILHSRVSAQGDVVVNGRRGFISGGEVHSASMIHARTAGSTMGTATVLEIGVDPQSLEEYRRMEKELPDLEAGHLAAGKNIAILARKLEKGEKLAQDKLLYLKTAIGSNQQIEQKISDYKKRMQDLQDEMNHNLFGSIKIIDTIHPGCKLIISGAVLYIRSITKHCRYVKEGADLKMLAY